MASRRKSAQPNAGDATSGSSTVSFALPASMDMRRVRGLKSSLEALDGRGADGRRQAILIDASAVRRCSFGCLQTLAAFCRDRSAQGATVRLVNLTEEIERSIELLGLRTTFQRAMEV